MDNRCIGFAELEDMNTPWREVLPLGKRRHYAKGEQIKHERQLYFLDRGLIRLTHVSREGKEKILWYINRGCIFGETPFFDQMGGEGESVHVCVTACEVYIFSQDCVHNDIARQRPELILNLLPSLARKVRLLSNHASSLSVDEVCIRMCKFLGQRLVPASEPLRVKPGISRHEMASLLGVHRVTLFKIIKQMEVEGIFAPYDRNSFVILQPAAFFRMVEA